MAIGSAAGKIILFGEHAVVYGRPALAVPLSDLRAQVRVQQKNAPGVIIHSRELGRTHALETAPADDPLAAITRAALAEFNLPRDIDLELEIESDIPLASGLGSGAAVSTAIVRALADYARRPLSPGRTSALVYETERIYHGTPSGIDNAVVAYEKALRFTRQRGAQPIALAQPFMIMIADTGIPSPTKTTVGNVRRAWEREPARFERFFDQIAEVVEQAQTALARGAIDELGPLMNQNQELLRGLGVSSPEIEKLLDAALQAGAPGGKLSGGGGGGNVIIYIEETPAAGIEKALLDAGAVRVIKTEVS